MPEKENFDINDIDSFFKSLQTNTGQLVQPVNTIKPVDTASAAPRVSAAQGSSIEVSALQNLLAIEKELNLTLVEREEAIHCLMLAVIAGQHMLMLGPAGAGKSMLASEFCSRISNGIYFQWLLNKTSDPSEVVGAVSIKSMENDHYKRITTGKLPEAHLAFIDEVYKSNSPTLNLLLPIMNEKIFYNDGQPVKIPLITMVGASNEPPEDDSLLPFHDRFMFRMNMKYIKDATSKKRMFTNFLAERASSTTITQKTRISLQELKALEAKAKRVGISKDIINQYIRILKAISRKTGVVLSDRRQNECLKILQASAVLRGADYVSTNDFNSLVYALWEEEDQIEPISEEIANLVNPYDNELALLMKNFNEICSAVEGETDDKLKVEKCIDAKASIDKVLAKLNKITIEAANQGISTEQFESAKNKIAEYTKDVLSQISSQLI